MIGVVGGMSWEASAAYYVLLNRQSNGLWGGHRTVETVMVSVDFEQVLDLVTQGQDDAVGELIASAARATVRAGARIVLLAAVTAHRWADVVAKVIAPIPLLHVATPLGLHCQARNIHRVGLLGTLPTMGSPILIDPLRAQYGLQVVTPPPERQTDLHELIMTECSRGIFSDTGRGLVEMIRGYLLAERVDAIILGCTELPLLLGGAASEPPYIDIAAIHVDGAISCLVR